LSLLEVSNLHVWFDLPHGGEVHAVAGVSFALAEGERFGLVGESGCGKTTTVLGLMGLLPPNASVAGEVRIDGRSILAGGEDSVRPHRWKDVAMVFQGAMNALNPVKKVGWQIAEPMAFHGIAHGAAARRRAGELLEMVGIPAAAAERYPHEFSGGMRQRASIAMALACQPRILLADEPTTALDVMVQAQILELLTGLSRDLGLALVLVTHDLPVVAQVCDRAAVMYAGEIVETGPMEALFHTPRHPYTRLLFAATPDLYGDEPVVSIPGAPPRLDQAITGCPFRPRCDSAFGRCETEHPVLRHVAAGQEAAGYQAVGYREAPGHAAAGQEAAGYQEAASHEAACHLGDLPAEERVRLEGARLFSPAPGPTPGAAP
jgi:peptide/nickel transport system ATP-binding protein